MICNAFGQISAAQQQRLLLLGNLPDAQTEVAPPKNIEFSVPEVKSRYGIGLVEVRAGIQSV